MVLNLWFLPFLFRNLLLEGSKMVILDPLGGRDSAMFIQTTATQRVVANAEAVLSVGMMDASPGGACSRGLSCASLTAVLSQF